MIPVFEPLLDDDDLQAIVAAFKRGEISGSFGTAVPEFERAFSDYCGVAHSVAVSSGTTALQVAVAAAGIGSGDEVLMSACTNIATALAVIHNGAIPVPVDTRVSCLDVTFVGPVIRGEEPTPPGPGIATAPRRASMPTLEWPRNHESRRVSPDRSAPARGAVSARYRARSR